MQSFIGNNMYVSNEYEPKCGMKVNGKYFVKVNFPSTEEDEHNGSGEGMWVIVSEAVCRAYDNDVVGMRCEGVLDNDSFYYPGLNHGTKVEFEMRGDSRPVVSCKWLTENYGESTWRH